MQMKKEKKSWQVGKWALFNDSGWIFPYSLRLKSTALSVSPIPYSNTAREVVSTRWKRVTSFLSATIILVCGVQMEPALYKRFIPFGNTGNLMSWESQQNDPFFIAIVLN